MRDIAIWFLLGMTYAVGGWVAEVCISLIQRRKFVNRGFLIGPVCPIYGTGALLISLIARPDESPLVIFCVAAVGSAILEYSVSYIMEKLFRVRWWDYTKSPFNLNGRISAFSVISFGIVGIIALKVINPWLFTVYGSLPPMVLFFIAGAIAVILLCDIAVSLWLMVGVRIAVGTVQRDATDEISTRVREILTGKGKLNRRLVKAFPNHAPSKKPPARPKSQS